MRKSSPSNTPDSIRAAAARASWWRAFDAGVGRRWRLALVLLAGTVVVLAGAVITSLHNNALASRTSEERMLEVRRLIADSDALAWQMLAQGTPNFTFSQTLSGDAARANSDLAAFGRSGSQDAGVPRIASMFAVFEQQLAVEQRLIAQHRLSEAYTEVLDSVDGTAQLLRAATEDLRTSFSASAERANSRLYWGSLGALGVSAALVAALAAAFATGRRRALAAERSALERSERRFRALVQRASEVVIVADADRRITYVTEAAVSLLGHAPAALEGRRLEELVAADEQLRARRVADRAIRVAPAESPSEWTIVRPDGSTAFVETQSDNRFHDPDVGGLVVTMRDVTQRHEIEAQLRHQALHDPLTGLANRALFEDRVGHALLRVRRSAPPVSLVYLDLDEFKAVNDSLGHGAGDRLLRVVAERISDCVRVSDTTARLGGDEFACLLEDLDDADGALAVAERILEALVPPVVIDDRSISVRASVGVAHADDISLTAEDLIRNGDLAMYAAKAAGKGAIAVFHDDLLVAARRRLDLREDLRRAIERDELTLAYQPLVDLNAARPTGVEALMRWHHAQEGPVAPARFIPLAEENGTIVALGRWALDRALADLRSWSPLAPELRLNLNVAPRELLEDDYVDAVATALRRHEISPERLTLEVTESAFLGHGDMSKRLEELDELGVRLAIDDFGTGHSSLARLQRFPVSQVKVDRSFLSAIDESAHSATLVQSIIEMGSALGLQMVAEGIERESQLDVLRASPCPLGQGFLFGRPQGPEAIAELLAKTGTGEAANL